MVLTFLNDVEFKLEEYAGIIEIFADRYGSQRLMTVSRLFNAVAIFSMPYMEYCTPRYGVQTHTWLSYCLPALPHLCIFTYHHNQNPITVTIDTNCLDGISITHTHVCVRHCFTAVLCEGCMVASPWVGENYFCESSTQSVSRSPYPGEEFCCKLNNLPSLWFTRVPTKAATDDIEV